MQQTLIDTPTALSNLCQQLAEAPWIAVDTEFVRERSYHAHLCLLQVASDTALACIDTLALAQLEPLIEILCTPDIVKVMHGSQQDLEIFQRLWGQVPTPLFDTQIAAALLGQGEQIGYAPLVQALLDMPLDKSQTRTDWSQRPLSAAQLHYAADDVRFLGALYQRQRGALLAHQRLDWLWAETQKLCELSAIPPSTDSPWRRVKGHRNLRGIHLAVLRNLSQWREQQAEARDLPRQWVIRDEQLLTLARRMPRTGEQLQRLNLDKRLLHRDSQALLQQIHQAIQAPPENWPQSPAYTPLDSQQQALLEQAQGAIRQCAEQHGLSPALLATRRDLERWVVGGQIPALEGWRNTLLGDTLRQLHRRVDPASPTTGAQG